MLYLFSWKLFFNGSIRTLRLKVSTRKDEADDFYSRRRRTSEIQRRVPEGSRVRLRGYSTAKEGFTKTSEETAVVFSHSSGEHRAVWLQKYDLWGIQRMSSFIKWSWPWASRISCSRLLSDIMSHLWQLFVQSKYPFCLINFLVESHGKNGKLSQSLRRDTGGCGIEDKRKGEVALCRVPPEDFGCYEMQFAANQVIDFDEWLWKHRKAQDLLLFISFIRRLCLVTLCVKLFACHLTILLFVPLSAGNRRKAFVVVVVFICIPKCAQQLM